MSQNRDQPAPRPGAGLNWKHWLVIGIVTVLCCGGIVMANSNFNDPTDKIQDDYARASTLDEGRGRAYTSTDSPATVAAQISSSSEPREQRSQDGAYYLQYSKHIVAVTPYQGGSKILLDDYRDGYQRYAFLFIPWGWSSSPPSPFRGGGPGFGK